MLIMTATGSILFFQSLLEILKFLQFIFFEQAVILGKFYTFVSMRRISAVLPAAVFISAVARADFYFL